MPRASRCQERDGKSVGQGRVILQGAKRSRGGAGRGVVRREGRGGERVGVAGAVGGRLCARVGRWLWAWRARTEACTGVAKSRDGRLWAWLDMLWAWRAWTDRWMGVATTDVGVVSSDWAG